jgi:hypothetical protein
MALKSDTVQGDGSDSASQNAGIKELINAFRHFARLQADLKQIKRTVSTTEGIANLALDYSPPKKYD